MGSLWCNITILAELSNSICLQIPCDNETDEENKIEMIKTFLEEPDIELLPGDPVVISELLLACSQRLCTQEYIKVRT